MVRGANLQAIRQSGIKPGPDRWAANRWHAQRRRPPTTTPAAGVHDLVILAMKAHQVEAVLPDLHHLIGPDTVDRADAERHPVLVLP